MMLVITRCAGEGVVLVIDRRVVMEIDVAAIAPAWVRLEFASAHGIAARTREEAIRAIEDQFDDSGPCSAA